MPQPYGQPGRWVGQVYRPDDFSLYALPEETILPPGYGEPVTAPEQADTPLTPTPAPMIQPPGAAPMVPGEVPQQETTEPVEGAFLVGSMPWVKPPSPVPAANEAYPGPDTTAPNPYGRELPKGVYEIDVDGLRVPVNANGTLYVAPGEELTPAQQKLSSDPTFQAALAAGARAQNQTELANLVTADDEEKKRIANARDKVVVAAQEKRRAQQEAEAKVVDAARLHVADATKKFADYEINAPERPAWRSTLGLVAIALSAIGQVRSRDGGPNPALELLRQRAQDEAAQRQLQYQKLGINVKLAKGEYADLLSNAKSGQEVYATTMAGIYDAYARQMEAVAAKTADEQKKIGQLEIAAKTNEEAAKWQETAAQERAKNNIAEREKLQQIESAKAKILDDAAKNKLTAWGLSLESKRDKLAASKQFVDTALAVSKENRDWLTFAKDSKLTPTQQADELIKQAELQDHYLIDFSAEPKMDKRHGLVSQWILDKGQKPTVFPTSVTASVKPKQAVQMRLLAIKQQLADAMEEHGGWDKALGLVGYDTELTRKIESLQSQAGLILSKSDKSGALDAGSVSEYKKQLGGDLKDFAAATDALQGVIDNIQVGIDAEIQGSGLTADTMSKTSLPNMNRPKAPTNKALDELLKPHAGTYITDDREALARDIGVHSDDPARREREAKKDAPHLAKAQKNIAELGDDVTSLATLIEKAPSHTVKQLAQIELLRIAMKKGPGAEAAKAALKGHLFAP